jgi:hypothetical protein
VYAIAVAIVAFVWQYVLFKPHGLILMLAAASIAVPFINWCWPRKRFEWSDNALLRAIELGRAKEQR